MESKTAKKRFCSTLHRIYWNRMKSAADKIGKAVFVEKIKKDSVVTNNVPKEINTPKTLDQLKAICPKELTGLDRSEWIAKERVKYNI